MRTFLLLFCTTVFSFTSGNILSQNAKVTIDADKTVTVDEVFKIVIQQTDYSFAYRADLFKDFPKVTLKKGVIRMDKLINQSISGGNFNVVLTENNTILIKEAATQQQQQITGKVTDAAGLPVPGVTVLIKGTGKGTVTDFDGNYSIIVPNPENVLVFSSLGFENQEITVGDKSVINVTLKEAVATLEEVTINAGYYKTTDKKKTGSISQVKAKQITEQAVSDPIQAIQGRVPGLLITQVSGQHPGGYLNVQIRGKNSINSGSNPLYIVDGIPYPSSTVDGGSGVGTTVSTNATNPLATLNPVDIESIEVLKDADATSIYGSRGANGVIVITTKRGKAGQTNFNVDFYSGIGQMNQRLDLMSTAQYLDMRSEAFQNDGVTPTAANAPDLVSWSPETNNDYQDILFGGTSNITNLNASLTAGNEKTNFIASFGYRKEGNLQRLDDLGYHKYTGRLAVDHNMLDNKLSFGANVLFSSINSNRPYDISIWRLYQSPNAPLFNDNGSLYWGAAGFQNPYAAFALLVDNKEQNFTSNFSLMATLAKGLQFNTLFGYSSIQNNKYDSFLSDFTSSGYTLARSGSASVKTLILEPQLTYELLINDFKFNSIFGATYQNSNIENALLQNSNFPNDALVGNISAGTNLTLVSNSTEYKYASVYIRSGIDFKDRYLLNATYRRDGSSRFGPGKRIGNFYSVAGAWIFTEETSLKGNNTFSFGKIRASYGTTGNDQIADYRYLETYQVASQPYITTALIPSRLANPLYSWEINKKFEVGLELGLINDRIRLTTNYFNNRSSNQLVGQPIPSQTGFSSYQANLPALVENTGWEIDLNMDILQNDAFSWSSNFNITLPKNKLVSFEGIENTTFANTYTVGRPLDHYRGYILSGIDPATGNALFEDINNDGVAPIYPSDYTFIGKKYPDAYGGFYNEFRYKKFNFNFMFQFKLGFKQQSATNGVFQNGILSNQLAEVYGNYWSQPGDIASFPRVGVNYQPPLYNYTSSDKNLRDASFVRLGNVYLSYDLNNPTFDKWGIKDSALYITGQNVFTLTDYNGLDPETGYDRLPPLQIWSLGIKLTL